MANDAQTNCRITDFFDKAQRLQTFSITGNNATVLAYRKWNLYNGYRMQLLLNYFPKLASNSKHFEDLNNNFKFVLKDSLNFKHQFHRQPNYLQHSIRWMQYIFKTFNKRSNTTQHSRQLQLTKQHLQKYDTIFHNSILLHFSAQMQQQQCNINYKSNQKLQMTTERTNCSSHICKFYRERITYWAYPIFE